MTGYNGSADFPTTPGAYDESYNGAPDAFVTKLNESGTALVYSTYLGGTGTDSGYAIAVDATGNAYVTGYVDSADFPITPGAYDESFNGGPDAFVTKLDLIPLIPATLTLSPAAGTNPVGTSHTVTATVKVPRARGAADNPVPNVIVRFSVTGSVTASGECTTDASGQCGFTYEGPLLPGADAITAFANTNGNGTQDPLGEPSGAATKTWVPPVSTPLCEVTIASGGRITAANEDKATFGGHAKLSAAGGPGGQQTYQDHGPAQPMTVKSINVLAVVCSADRTQADIYGQATIDGAGSSSTGSRCTISASSARASTSTGSCSAAATTQGSRRSRQATFRSRGNKFDRAS